MTAARDVAADGLNGAHDLPDVYAWFDLKLPGSRQLLFRYALDVSYGMFHGLQEFATYLARGGSHLVTRNPNIVGSQFQVVQLLRPCEYRRVSATPDVANDPGGDPLRRHVPVPARAQELFFHGGR
jgi:hypothetical protein